MTAEALTVEVLKHHVESGSWPKLAFIGLFAGVCELLLLNI